MQTGTENRYYVLPKGTAFEKTVSEGAILCMIREYNKSKTRSELLEQFIDNVTVVGSILTDRTISEHIANIVINDSWVLTLEIPTEEEKEQLTPQNTKYYLIGGEAHQEYCRYGFESVLNNIKKEIWEEYVHYQLFKLTSVDQISGLIQEIEGNTLWIELSKEEGERLNAVINEVKPDKVLHVTFEDRNMNTFHCNITISEEAFIKLKGIKSKWLHIREENWHTGGIEVPMTFNVYTNLEERTYLIDVEQGQPVLNTDIPMPLGAKANNLFRPQSVFVNHQGIRLIIENRDTGETTGSEEVSFKWLEERF